MTFEQIAVLGRKVSLFLALFADCFGRRDARGLLKVYVKGQLSNLRRKNVEAIALQAKTAPRTLQRFLESIKWDEEKLRNRCQQIIIKDNAGLPTRRHCLIVEQTGASFGASRPPYIKTMFSTKQSRFITPEIESYNSLWHRHSWWHRRPACAVNKENFLSHRRDAGATSMRCHFYEVPLL